MFWQCVTYCIFSEPFLTLVQQGINSSTSLRIMQRTEKSVGADRTVNGHRGISLVPQQFFLGSVFLYVCWWKLSEAMYSYSSQTPGCNSQHSSRKVLSCTVLNLHFVIDAIRRPTCCASLTGHTFASLQSSCWLMILFILHFHVLCVCVCTRCLELHCASTDVQQDRAVIVRVVSNQNPVLNPLYLV